MRQAPPGGLSKPLDYPGNNLRILGNSVEFCVIISTNSESTENSSMDRYVTFFENLSCVMSCTV